VPWIEDAALEGALVRLVPMAIAHVDALCDVGLDPDIWRWMPSKVRDRAGMTAFVEGCLAAREAGTALPFVTTTRDAGLVVGATRFMNMAPADLRVEIGGTWIAPAWQRSRVNSEAKFLMLRHAFERWGCRRVEFKTSALNARSRAAILRIGAQEEGTLRKHMVQEAGSARDSVYFSIVDDEWPAVKARLQAALAQPRGS
jgi:RimJ/RimL family protein N-acetyltransferase